MGSGLHVGLQFAGDRGLRAALNDPSARAGFLYPSGDARDLAVEPSSRQPPAASRQPPAASRQHGPGMPVVIEGPSAAVQLEI